MDHAQSAPVKNVFVQKIKHKKSVNLINTLALMTLNIRFIWL